MPQPRTLNGPVAFVGFCATWTAVLIANVLAPKETTPPTFDVPQTEELSPAFREAADDVEVHVVQILAGSGDVSEGNSGAELSRVTLNPLGCGVIVNSSGLVLTTSHVIGDHKQLFIRTAANQLLEVSSTHKDPQSELATVSISSVRFDHVAQVGQSKAFKDGDRVLSVCQTGGRRRVRNLVTIHSGSHHGGSRFSIEAAAGAPVEGTVIVDLTGDILGIVTYRGSSQPDQTEGTVLPVDREHRWLAEQMGLAKGTAQVKLGFAVSSLTQDVVSRLNLGHENGAIVSQVYPNSPGKEAGLQAGDVVLALGYEPISSANDVDMVASLLNAGSHHPIEIVRDGLRMTLHLNVPSSLNARMVE